MWGEVWGEVWGKGVHCCVGVWVEWNKEGAPLWVGKVDRGRRLSGGGSLVVG